VNGKTRLAQIKSSSGISVQTINGEREAELIWQGCMHAADFGEGPSLVIDIGGGSVECIIGDRKKIYWLRSVPIGAARLKEKYPLSEPSTRKEQEQLTKGLELSLSPLIKACKRYQPARLIGSSGTFETFAAIIHRQQTGKSLPAAQRFYTFRKNDLFTLHRTFLRATLAERLQMPGMLRMRADMIVQASAVAQQCILLSKVNKIHLSTYSLKEGLMFEICKSLSNKISLK